MSSAVDLIDAGLDDLLLTGSSPNIPTLHHSRGAGNSGQIGISSYSPLLYQTTR